VRKLLALAALAAAAVLPVACGGGSDQKTRYSTVKLSADPKGKLGFDTNSLSTKAGIITIVFRNPSSVGHDIAIEDRSGEGHGVTSVIKKGTATLSLALKPGTYKYLCTVPGHAAAGMQGTLTVK
jgi:plastocyanin